MRTTLVLLLAAPALFGECQEDADAAIAMARARAARVAAAANHVPYADAVDQSTRSGKPVLVTIGMDCRELCKHLRPDVITCKEREYAGDATPRSVLLLPDCNGQLWQVKAWAGSVPPAADVKAAIETGKKLLPKR